MDESEINKAIGLRIKELRENKRLSQLELGVRIGLTECQAQQYIYKYEKGMIRIPASRIADIARVLGLPVCLLYPEHIRNTCRFGPLVKGPEKPGK